MAYASGGLIEATDYNGFVASVNAIWGVGSGDSGYGQVTTLSTVTAAVSTVTATQWSDLITRIDSMKNHQNVGAPGSGITKPVAGGTITFLSTLSTQIANITTNKLLNAGDGFGTNIASGTIQLTNAAGWTTVRTQEISLTWGSYNQMRYFFNTGGYATATVANSVFSGNIKSTTWDAFCTAFGTLRLNAQTSEKVGGSGTLSTNNTTIGFHDLTTTHQTIFEQFESSATYNTNYLTFQARLNATHASGTATILYLKIIYTDASADFLDDTVTGTAQMDVTAIPSGITYISNTWGGVTGASVTNT